MEFFNKEGVALIFIKIIPGSLSTSSKPPVNPGRAPSETCLPGVTSQYFLDNWPTHRVSWARTPWVWEPVLSWNTHSFHQKCFKLFKCVFQLDLNQISLSIVPWDILVSVIVQQLSLTSKLSSVSTGSLERATRSDTSNSGPCCLTLLCPYAGVSHLPSMLAVFLSFSMSIPPSHFPSTVRSLSPLQGYNSPRLPPESPVWSRV